MIPSFTGEFYTVSPGASTHGGTKRGFAFNAVSLVIEQLRYGLSHTFVVY
jgi:hypothetical protein